MIWEKSSIFGGKSGLSEMYGDSRVASELAARTASMSRAPRCGWPACAGEPQKDNPGGLSFCGSETWIRPLSTRFRVSRPAVRRSRINCCNAGNIPILGRFVNWLRATSFWLFSVFCICITIHRIKHRSGKKASFWPRQFFVVKGKCCAVYQYNSILFQRSGAS